MKLWEVFRFEIRHQLRRRSVWLHVGALLALVFYAVREMTTAEEGDVFINAPAQLLEYIGLAGLWGLVVTAALAGEAATRDARARMEGLLYTAPVGKGALLGGRFLGVLALNVALMVAATGVVALAVYSSDAAPEMLGPFEASAYLRPFLIVALPNAFIGSVLLFVAALLTRRAVASYVVGGVLFAGVLFHLTITAQLLEQYGLAAGLDAQGLIAAALHYRSLTPLEKNTLPVPFEGWLAFNRLLWLGIAAAVGALAAHRFRLAHYAPRGGFFRRAGRRRPAPDPVAAAEGRSAAPVAVPLVPRAFGGAVRVRQTGTVAGRAFRQLVGGWGWVPLAGLALLQVLTGPEVMEFLGVPLMPTTARTVMLFGENAIPYFVTALLIFYAGELVWGDREAGLDALVDAAPVPDGALLLGRLLGLGLVVVVIQGLLMGAGLIVQAYLGYTDFEPGLYLGVLFGLQLADYALFAVLAFAVHVLVNHKYVGHLAALLLYAFTLGATYVGVEHHLLAYGTAPAWTYAEMTGFGASLRPFLLFKLYWTGWALLLVVVARLYRVRGAEHGLRHRHRRARRGFTVPVGGLAVAGVAIVLLAGGFVFYNTNVLNAYRTADAYTARSADYERRYGRYEDAPQPRATAADVHVELYPEQRTATVRGTYRFVNDTGAALDTLHLATSPEVRTEPMTFDRAAEAVLVDDDLGHRIYRLARPLLPGDTLRMQFAVRYAPRGFANDGAANRVVERGVFVQADAWLPRLGYQQNRRLTSAGARKDHGLPPRPAAPPLEDEAARYDLRDRSLIDLDVTVGTARDHTAVAPGALRRTWTEGGRRYFRYVTDRPVRDDFPVLSARYAVHEARWQDPDAPGRAVRIQVFYQPGRAWNVERFVRSAQATLTTLSARLGPYPHGQLKIVAAPDPGVGATAFPGLITVRDGLAALRPDEDPRDVDFAFAVMAHEVAHQWWGHQLVPALVEGAPVLTESLAWYGAMDAVEDAFGTDHLRRLMGVLGQAYLAPRPESGVPLLRVYDWFGAYRKGPFVMYALREYVGEAPVNEALRQLLAEHGAGTPPLPTSLDLYRALQGVTPDSLHYLLTDLFERNTFWDLEAERATAEPAGNGAWRVTLDVAARKVAVDSVGIETEHPMDDLVEVGVYAAEDSTPLYLQIHRVRSGAQTITVTVPREPARAGIDPRRLLIDTNGLDNTVDVETAAADS